jgi:hypothetical protein
MPQYCIQASWWTEFLHFDVAWVAVPGLSFPFPSQLAVPEPALHLWQSFNLTIAAEECLINLRKRPSWPLGKLAIHSHPATTLWYLPIPGISPTSAYHADYSPASPQWHQNSCICCFDFYLLAMDPSAALMSSLFIAATFVCPQAPLSFYLLYSSGITATY